MILIFEFLINYGRAHMVLMGKYGHRKKYGNNQRQTQWLEKFSKKLIETENNTKQMELRQSRNLNLLV